MPRTITVNLTEEEFRLVMKHRAGTYNKWENRQNTDARDDCKHLTFDCDGDQCTLNKGYGVGNHCYVYSGKECDRYECESDTTPPQKCRDCKHCYEAIKGCGEVLLYSCDKLRFFVNPDTIPENCPLRDENHK